MFPHWLFTLGPFPRVLNPFYIFIFLPTSLGNGSVDVLRVMPKVNHRLHYIFKFHDLTFHPKPNFLVSGALSFDKYNPATDIMD